MSVRILTALECLQMERVLETCEDILYQEGFNEESYECAECLSLLRKLERADIEKILQ